ncbi:DNA repair protein RadA [Patescibacteria group bacterium]|nr:DNA repair protein RadA [Patescibacteria group bacterium]
MPKTKAVPLFLCKKCDAQLLKWSGQCPECQAWGTVQALGEGVAVSTASVARRTIPGKAIATSPFTSLETANNDQRLTPTIPFWQRLLSGGFVPGSVTLLGGEPGIGKSTLLAQLALDLANAGKAILYVTGEESPSQVSRRLSRLQPPPGTLPERLHFLDANDAASIAATIAHAHPDLTIVDSIQSLRAGEVAGEPGNPTQMKAAAAFIHEQAKAHNCAVILVGQVTKDGDLAGPRLLEHLVDTVLMMEGDRAQMSRILRPTKHRFGSTEESVFLEMDEQGLREIPDASAVFLADRPRGVPGTIAGSFIHGARPLFVEIQSLVSPAGYATPMRRVSGLDANRLNLILAVLARRCGLGFGDQDVFANLVGGLGSNDPSLDLPIALALASAKQDIAIPATCAAWGEVGLAGELRAVPNGKLRFKEAARLGFTIIIVPAHFRPEEETEAKQSNLKILRCKTLKEAVEELRKW